MKFGCPISRLAPFAFLNAGLFVAGSVGGSAPASGDPAPTLTRDTGCGISTSSVPFSHNASGWRSKTQLLRTRCGNEASTQLRSDTAGAQMPVPQWKKRGRLIAFDPPGTTKVGSTACGYGCGSEAIAINSSAAVVGYYYDVYAVPHGFLRSRDGRFLSFDGPGAGLGHGLNEGTEATGITSDFTILGNVETPGLTIRGYIGHAHGGFTMIDAPGAATGSGLGTFAISINDDREIAGYSLYANGSQGFVRSPRGVFSLFSPPGAVYTFVTALDSAGETSGYYLDASNTYHGFLRMPNGAIKTVDAPGAGRGTPTEYLGTFLESVNSAGVSVGDFDNVVNSQFGYHAVERYPNGSISTFRSGDSVAYAIDSAGAITGEYSSSLSAAYRGLARSANGALATFAAPGAGTGSYQGTLPIAINATETVTGYWIDANNLNHSFIWSPR